MNNATRTLAIVAVFMAATLVVGTFATEATTQPALAYSQKKPQGHDDKKTKDNGSGNGNGNTVTVEKCQNKGSSSGFDTAVDQECENLICTHPGDNATCVSESEAAATPTSTSTSSSPPAPIPVNTVTCNNTATPFNGQLTQQCCIIVQINITAGTTQTNAATNACTIAVTNTGDITGTLPTGTTVPISAMSLKASDAKCVNGASGSLNTGTGKTFSVCVNA
jgi:hypothetical protein